MLKRFMSWLLHRLQKLLSPLGNGRRHHSHSSMPAQNAVEPEQGKDYVAPSEGYSKPEPSSLGSSTPLSSQTATESEDTLPVESDIYVSVDAAAATQGIPSNPNAATAASELIASGALNYLLEPPNTGELPEIHDLLPALEPEEAVEISESEALIEIPPDLPEQTLADDEPVELVAEASTEAPIEAASAEPVEQVARPDEAHEASPEETIEAAVDSPAQAVLFSFDIVESEPAPVEAAVPEPSVPTETPVEETPSETLYPSDFAVALPAEAIAFADYTSKGADDADNLHSGEDVESQENPDSERLAEEIAVVESVPAALETGQIDIVIEVAAPEENEPAEPILTSDSQSPEVLSSEADSSTENADEATDQSLSEEPVKQGVVKLLFTLKQGNFHGYIAPDDGTKDILFHQKYINADIFDRLERGSRVVAGVKYIEGKAYATRVDLL